MLCQRRIEASATLLDEGEVESRCKSDRLEVIGESGQRGVGIDDASIRVGVASWDRRMLSDVQTGDRLGKW